MEWKNENIEAAQAAGPGDIFVHIIEEPMLLSDEQAESFLRCLPVGDQNYILQFKRKEDRVHRLLGRLLMMQALACFNIDPSAICYLSINKSGRPSLKGIMEFNISHTEGLVVCAAQQAGRLGIDVEKIKPIQRTHLESSMNAAQWQQIQNANDPAAEFFRCWTLKESVIKADGRGLFIHLAEIPIDGDTIILSGHNWRLHPLQLNSRYVGYVASDDARSIYQYRFYQPNLQVLRSFSVYPAEL